MAKMPKEVVDLFDDPMGIKMLGTTDKTLQPNLVVIASCSIWDEETLAFACIALGKTKQNLETTKRATITVHKAPNLGYQVKGIFRGWQTEGPVYDKVATQVKDMLQTVEADTSGFAVDSVGTMKVTDVYSVKPGLKGLKIA